MLRSAPLLLVVLLLLAFHAAAPTGPLQPASAPSGDYLERLGDGSFRVWQYDNATGVLSPTPDIVHQACLGDPEARIFLAGVCVDVDVAPGEGGEPRVDAVGRIALVGEWQEKSRLKVQGREWPHCDPACFGDEVPGLTYLYWNAVLEDVCPRSPPGKTLTAWAEVVAKQPKLAPTVSDEDAQAFACPKPKPPPK